MFVLHKWLEDRVWLVIWQQGTPISRLPWLNAGIRFASTLIHLVFDVNGKITVDDSFSSHISLTFLDYVFLSGNLALKGR